MLSACTEQRYQRVEMDQLFVDCPGNAVTPGLNAWLKHKLTFWCFAGCPDVQR